MWIDRLTSRKKEGIATNNKEVRLLIISACMHASCHNNKIMREDNITAKKKRKEEGKGEERNETVPLLTKQPKSSKAAKDPGGSTSPKSPRKATTGDKPRHNSTKAISASSPNPVLQVSTSSPVKQKKKKKDKGMSNSERSSNISTRDISSLSSSRRSSAFEILVSSVAALEAESTHADSKPPARRRHSIASSSHKKPADKDNMQRFNASLPSLQPLSPSMLKKSSRRPPSTSTAPLPSHQRPHKKKRSPSKQPHVLPATGGEELLGLPSIPILDISAHSQLKESPQKDSKEQPRKPKSSSRRHLPSDENDNVQQPQKDPNHSDSTLNDCSAVFESWAKETTTKMKQDSTLNSCTAVFESWAKDTATKLKKDETISSSLDQGNAHNHNGSITITDELPSPKKKKTKRKSAPHPGYTWKDHDNSDPTISTVAITIGDRDLSSRSTLSSSSSSSSPSLLKKLPPPPPPPPFPPPPPIPTTRTKHDKHHVSSRSHHENTISAVVPTTSSSERASVMASPPKKKKKRKSAPPNALTTTPTSPRRHQKERIHKAPIPPGESYDDKINISPVGNYPYTAMVRAPPSSSLVPYQHDHPRAFPSRQRMLSPAGPAKSPTTVTKTKTGVEHCRPTTTRTPKSASPSSSKAKKSHPLLEQHHHRHAATDHVHLPPASFSRAVVAAVASDTNVHGRSLLGYYENDGDKRSQEEALALLSSDPLCTQHLYHIGQSYKTKKQHNTNINVMDTSSSNTNTHDSNNSKDAGALLGPRRRESWRDSLSASLSSIGRPFSTGTGASAASLASTNDSNHSSKNHSPSLFGEVQLADDSSVSETAKHALATEKRNDPRDNHELNYKIVLMESLLGDIDVLGKSTRGSAHSSRRRCSGSERRDDSSTSFAVETATKATTSVGVLPPDSGDAKPQVPAKRRRSSSSKKSSSTARVVPPTRDAGDEPCLAKTKSSKGTSSFSSKQAIIDIEKGFLDDQVDDEATKVTRSMSLVQPQRSSAASLESMSELFKVDAKGSKRWCWFFVVFAVVIAGLIIAIIAGLITTRSSPAPTLAPTSFEYDVLPWYSRRALHFPYSPQSRAFAWLEESEFRSSMSTSQTLQRFALATLFYSTGGDQWKSSKGWLAQTKDECSWFRRHFHSICDSLGRIHSLSLPDNSVSPTKRKFFVSATSPLVLCDESSFVRR